MIGPSVAHIRSHLFAFDTFRGVLREGESMQSMKSKLLFRGFDGVIGFSVADELQSEDDGAADTLDDGFGIDTGWTDPRRHPSRAPMDRAPR
jgi:hypothetical protein